MKISKERKQMFAVIMVGLLILALIAFPKQNETHLYIDGVKVTFTDAVPKLINNRTMVPIRIISENMGYDVDWSKDTWSEGKQLVWISKGNTKVELEMNKSTALVNGVSVPIDKLDNGTIVDTKPFVENGRTFVPIRFISQTMGAKVDWEIKGGNLYVYITRTNTQPPVDPKPVDPKPVDPKPVTPSKIEGNADQGTDKENFAKIKDFFGEYQYGDGTPTFKAIGGSSENTFFWVSNDVNAPYRTKVVIESWYTPSKESSESAHLYRLINPAVKEVLRFYLPNGGADELYKIVDDGFNRVLTNVDSVTNKDISNLIGADRPVSIINAQSGLQVLIGSKR